jgi:hypothetical protein
MSGNMSGLLGMILSQAQAQGNLNLRPDQLSVQGQTLSIKFTVDDIKNMILANMSPEFRARVSAFMDVKIEGNSVVMYVRL